MVTRAGLTQRDFECEFDSTEDCLVAAFDCGLALVARTLSSAVGAEDRWLERVRLGTCALLGFFDQHPGWARLLVVAPPAAGPRALARRQRALETLTRLLHRESSGEKTVDGSLPSREVIAELLAGGAFSVIHTRIAQGEGRPLCELAPSLMAMIALPYLGADAARAELTTPHPSARAPAPLPTRGDPPKTRTTHRTILVLRAIAASPHSSNRDVAAAAGLSDEGQTSKLLQRLQRQGLIENVGLGQAHGEPNAWLLTSAGEQLVHLRGQESSRRTAPAPQPRGRAARRACQGRAS